MLSRFETVGSSVFSSFMAGLGSDCFNADDFVWTDTTGKVVC